MAFPLPNLFTTINSLASFWLINSTIRFSRVLTSPYTHFEHWPDVVQVGGAGKRGFGVAHGLHQSLGCLSHLFHLQVVEQPALLFTSDTCEEVRANSG